MNDSLRKEIIKLLEEGKKLPEELQYILFPTKEKEYKLTYAEKMRKEDILSMRMVRHLSQCKFRKNLYLVKIIHGII